MNEGSDGGRVDRTVSLRPCPCGAVPQRLVIDAEGDRPKWARVHGGCCDDWSIEFRNSYHPIGSAESQELAAQAWNEAARAG
jgi:hypothetical protein